MRKWKEDFFFSPLLLHQVLSIYLSPLLATKPLPHCHVAAVHHDGAKVLYVLQELWWVRRPRGNQRGVGGQGGGRRGAVQRGRRRRGLGGCQTSALLRLCFGSEFDQLPQDVVDERIWAQLSQHQHHQLFGVAQLEGKLHLGTVLRGRVSDWCSLLSGVSLWYICRQVPPDCLIFWGGLLEVGCLVFPRPILKPFLLAVRNSALLGEVTATASAADARMGAVAWCWHLDSPDLYIPGPRHGAQAPLPLSTIHMEVVQVQPQAEGVACPILQMVLHAHEAVSYIQLLALRVLLGTCWTPPFLLTVNTSLTVLVMTLEGDTRTGRLNSCGHFFFLSLFCPHS